ncbi:fungal-specific transcription factor domain-containing protein [Mycena olivaceomarginata]|nr:fungal-specific transcription factor domain-containing protein [Mycena olivaceomarginata]
MPDFELLSIWRPLHVLEPIQEARSEEPAKLRKLSVCSLCAQPLQSQAQGDGASNSSIFNHGDGASGSSVFNHGTPESDTSHTSGADGSEPVDGQDFTADRFQSSSGSEARRSRYFGAASSFALANSAIAAKRRSLGRPILNNVRRPLFWDVLPWEKEEYAIRPNYVFPDGDLIDSLLHIFWANINPTLPVLHRPSFERSVAEGLHLTNAEFGGTLLAVLAVASRYSNDPRVFVDGDTGFSAGWKFANQIRILRKLFEPTIHEVQMYCVLTLYSLSLSEPQVSWLYLGLGIRFLQQRGEHRRKPPEGREWSQEDELWRRAFWSFVALDRYMAAFLGRPMALHSEEYDAELPLEVGDEYWDQGFTQPPGKPSKLSYFICNLRLYEIMGDVMRRLYGSKKSKLLMGWDGPDWEPRTVAELDSAVNHFTDSIPAHLRWNPEHPPQGTFFDQSAILFIAYNYVRIAIHRQYIQNATNAISLSICAGAARAVLHTADAWLRKRQRIPLPNIINPVFVSGIILVLNLLATKRAGLPLGKNEDLRLVATAMEILKFSESRLQPIGRLWELLQELWSLDGSLPLSHPPNSENSENNSVEPAASAAATTPEPVCLPSTEIPPCNVPEDFFTQLRQSFEQPWNTAPSFDQSSQLEPGISVEQMLADASIQDANNSIFDDELMSMWMAAPTDVANINNWDAYMDNRSGDANANWYSNFGA